MPQAVAVGWGKDKEQDVVIQQSRKKSRKQMSQIEKKCFFNRVGKLVLQKNKL